MKIKNQVLNQVYKNHCLHIEILDKIIDFLGEDFVGVEPNNGDVFFKKNEIVAFVRASIGYCVTSVCINFILADYEGFQINFFHDSHSVITKPKGLPKELECFFQMANDLKEYLNVS